MAGKGVDKEYVQLLGRAIAAETKTAVLEALKTAFEEHHKTDHVPMLAKLSKLKSKQVWRDGALAGSLIAGGKVGWETFKKFLG